MSKRISLGESKVENGWKTFLHQSMRNFMHWNESHSKSSNEKK